MPQKSCLASHTKMDSVVLYGHSHLGKGTWLLVWLTMPVNKFSALTGGDSVCLWKTTRPTESTNTTWYHTLSPVYHEFVVDMSTRLETS